MSSIVTSLLSRARSWWQVRRLHQRAVGHLPQINPPRTYNEHIVHRILFDRDPRLTVISDKIAVKDFIARVVGEKYVVPLLGKWLRPEDIDWSRLPRAFVLKPNQLSGPFVVIGDQTSVDRSSVVQLINGWPKARFKFLPHIRTEWGYQGIEPFIMAEPLLKAPDGGVVQELNVFTFGGKAALVRVYKGRKLTAERRDGWFDVDGRQLAIRANHVQSGVFALPEAIRREAIDVAQAVSAGFSHLRVDFYMASGGLMIGELTPYSWGAQCRFTPPELDFELGKLWQSVDTTHIPTYESSAESDLTT